MYYIIIFGNYETAQLCAIRKLRNSELRDLDCAIRKLCNPELRDKTLLNLMYRCRAKVSGHNVKNIKWLYSLENALSKRIDRMYFYGLMNAYK